MAMRSNLSHLGLKDCENLDKGQLLPAGPNAGSLTGPQACLCSPGALCIAGQAPRAGRAGNHAALEAWQMAPRNAEGAGVQIAKKEGFGMGGRKGRS
jgi:hypothetical protein